MCVQLPVIRHGKNTVADSYFIIKYLERTYSGNIPLLSAEQEALSVAIQHLVDDCLLRGLAYHRWIQPQVSGIFSSTSAFRYLCSPALNYSIQDLNRIILHGYIG